MRLAAILIVLVQLLLRGAVMPCAAHAETPHHAGRPHVHLGGRAHHHTNAHAKHGHRHDRLRTNGGMSDSAPAPHHDDDAVYLADDAVICVLPGRASPTSTGGQWHAFPPCLAFGSSFIVDPRPRRVRPPGADAASIHTLLPHVLRV